MCILEQDTAVRESWALVRPQATALTAQFYDHLFALDPALRPLFHRTEPQARSRKLIAALDEIVRLLDDPDRLVAVIVPLGRRHAAYGVRDQDYDTATAALLAAFHDVLGERFTEAMEHGWREAHRLVSAVMRRAGQAEGR